MSVNDLRAVLEAATQGPWSAEVLGSEGYQVYGPRGEEGTAQERRRLRVARCGWESWEQDRANANYIATFDPPTVAALLDPRERIIDCLSWILAQDEVDVAVVDEAVDLWLAAGAPEAT